MHTCPCHVCSISCKPNIESCFFETARRCKELTVIQGWLVHEWMRMDIEIVLDIKIKTVGYCKDTFSFTFPYLPYWSSLSHALEHLQLTCSSLLCLKPSFPDPQWPLTSETACRWKRPTSRLMDNFVMYLSSWDKNFLPIMMVQRKMDPSKTFALQTWVMFYWTTIMDHGYDS